MIVPVILSGGSGTRLWPLSRPDRPKQFLPLVGEKSLFHATLERVSDQQSYHPPLVVANAAHKDLCLEELARSEGARLILEPCARNTAAAIMMAAEVVRQTYGSNQIMLVMPSDHVIGRPEDFHAAVAAGVSAAGAGRLVTFGVTPTGPETGYGYLEAGPPVAGAPDAYEVARFTEKPDLATAEEMVATGRHYWNGGIFMFQAGAFLEEAQRHAPEIYSASVAAIAAADQSGSCILPSSAELEPCPNISVDYAVMERSDRMAMVPLDAEWSDVGSWDALAEIDARASGQLQATAINSRNCYVRSDGAEISLVGVDDLVVVASGNQVLVMRKGHSQDIRELVAQMGGND